MEIGKEKVENIGTAQNRERETESSKHWIREKEKQG